MDHEPLQGVVVAFPQFAAWLLVALGSLLVMIVAFGGRLLLKRLDKIAEDLEGVYEKHHNLESRVSKIEGACRVIHHREHDGLV